MNTDRGIARGSAPLHTPAGYARRYTEITEDEFGGFDNDIGLLRDTAGPDTHNAEKMAWVPACGCMCWGLMVVGGEYHLATDPEYDSITPGLSIVFGWLFGGIYSLPWLMVALVIDLMKRRRGKDEPKAGP